MKQRIINITLSELGGAGIAAGRTHQYFLKANYDSFLLSYNTNNSQTKNAIKIKKNKITAPTKLPIGKRIKNKLTRTLKNIFRSAGKETQARNKILLYEKTEHYCYYTTKENECLENNFVNDFIKDGDIVIVYWIGDVLNTTNLLEISKHKKIKLFWYAVDFAAFTGGCHFPWECKGYMQDCSPCPALLDERDKFSYYQMKKKKENLNSLNISILTSSDYGIKHFKQSSVKYTNYYKLPYATDVEIFYPVNRESKDDTNKFNVFFNAFNEKDERKGSAYFEAILKNLTSLILKNNSSIKINLITVNPHYHNKLTNSIISVEAHKKTTTDKELAKLYQISDLFICTSTEDLCPLMVNEALLCGLPVFAFDIAANREYISNNENGFIIQPFNVELFSETLFHYLSNPKVIIKNGIEIHHSIKNLHEFKSWQRTFNKICQNN